jgi:predicted regulator of Ras-like GTPase activity (Roadblock/LC7/MglB family)
MRSSELPRLVSALREPIDTFVRDARVRVALLITSSGQILAQHGFTSSYEVMNVASLAAAAHASSRALAELLRVGRWKHMHHAGSGQEFFLATLDTPVEKLILVAIFDSESSLGLVQFFFGQLAERVGTHPDLATGERSTDQKSFERDLEAGLDRALSQPPRGES